MERTTLKERGGIVFGGVCGREWERGMADIERGMADIEENRARRERVLQIPRRVEQEMGV